MLARTGRHADPAFTCPLLQQEVLHHLASVPDPAAAVWVLVPTIAAGIENTGGNGSEG